MERKLREDPEAAEDIVDNLISLARSRSARGGVALRAIMHAIDRIDGSVAKRQEFQLSGPPKLVILVDGEDDDGEPPGRVTNS